MGTFSQIDLPVNKAPHLQSQSSATGSSSFSNQFPDSFIIQNLRYLAPETATSGSISPQSIVYGLGALLYEMIAGRRVDNLDEDGDQEVDLLKDIHRHVTYSPTDPYESGGSETTRELVAIINICLSKDVEKRYINILSLRSDLQKFIAFASRGRLTFEAGRADRLGRYCPPHEPLHRREALSEIARAARTSTHINVWGLSGVGKSHLVNHWATVNRNTFEYVGRAKLDQHTRRPVSSFSQVFENLMDRIIDDPAVDPVTWVRMLKRTLGTQFPFFVATLSQEYRRILGLELDVDLSRTNVSNLTTLIVLADPSVDSCALGLCLVSLKILHLLMRDGQRDFCNLSLRPTSLCCY
jgi:serine/threonine protein kinase